MDGQLLAIQRQQINLRSMVNDIIRELLERVVELQRRGSCRAQDPA